jgi:hypothetical protein
MKTMKIYLLTEKQLRNAIISWSDCPMQDVIDRLKPIELPSDEEIEKELLEHIRVSTIDPYKSFYFKAAMYGAKLVKEQILNQNK